MDTLFLPFPKETPNCSSTGTTGERGTSGEETDEGKSEVVLEEKYGAESYGRRDYHDRTREGGRTRGWYGDFATGVAQAWCRS